MDALPIGTTIRGFRVEEHLGQGGFGIVYRARHLELDTVSAIKEYFPAELAYRNNLTVIPKKRAFEPAYQDGLVRFRQEAQHLC